MAFYWEVRYGKKVWLLSTTHESFDCTAGFECITRTASRPQRKVVPATRASSSSERDQASNMEEKLRKIHTNHHTELQMEARSKRNQELSNRELLVQQENLENSVRQLQDKIKTIYFKCCVGNTLPQTVLSASTCARPRPKRCSKSCSCPSTFGRHRKASASASS